MLYRFYIRCLRDILNIKWWDRVRNTDLPKTASTSVVWTCLAHRIMYSEKRPIHVMFREDTCKVVVSIASGAGNRRVAVLNRGALWETGSGDWGARWDSLTWTRNLMLSSAAIIYNDVLTCRHCLQTFTHKISYCCYLKVLWEGVQL